MEEIRDAIYYEQLARYARAMARSHEDSDVARRLKESAGKYERKARQIRRTEEGSPISEKAISRFAFWWR